MSDRDSPNIGVRMTGKTRRPSCSMMIACVGQARAPAQSCSMVASSAFSITATPVSSSRTKTPGAAVVHLALAMQRLGLQRDEQEF